MQRFSRRAPVVRTQNTGVFMRARRPRSERTKRAGPPPPARPRTARANVSQDSRRRIRVGHSPLGAGARRLARARPASGPFGTRSRLRARRERGSLGARPSPSAPPSCASAPRRSPPRPTAPPVETLPPRASPASTTTSYRDIRFPRRRARSGRGRRARFQLQAFHLGFGYREPVGASTSSRAAPARRLIFDRRCFSYGPLVENPPSVIEDLGFSGFRIHARVKQRGTISTSSRCFRARATSAPSRAGRFYGLSARGLAIATAEPTGRGIPDLPRVLDSRPPPTTTGITIVDHALSRQPEHEIRRLPLRPEAGCIDGDGGRSRASTRAVDVADGRHRAADLDVLLRRARPASASTIFRGAVARQRGAC